MARAWHEKPLWEKVYLSDRGPVYQNAGKIIGHLGCSAVEFFDRAKKLPGYDKLWYENAARDLTVYEKREKGQYELHAAAKRVLRVLLGPAPDDPEYATWWRLRLVSVEQMKRDGLPVLWAEAPPVPLPDEKPKAPATKAAPKKSPRKKKAG
jgi:hypothetical protein